MQTVDVDVRARRWRWAAPALMATIVVVGTIAVLVGIGNTLSPLDAWRAWFADAQTVPILHRLAVEVRTPRVVLGCLAGLALGASGALLQALTRNPLASPDLTGVTAGAVAAAVAWTAFGPTLGVLPIEWVRPTVAIAGALLTSFVVYLVTRRGGAVESTRLLLVGILAAGVLSSITSLSLLFMGPEASKVLGWLAGSLATTSWQDVWIVCVYCLPGVLLLPGAIGRAGALQLGDDVAVSLGQRRELDRVLVLVSTVLLTSGVVAVIGALGFVGLMAPHFARRFLGSNLRRLVPASALIGAAMVVVADLVARLFDPRWVFFWLGEDRIRASSLPVGVYLTLFGVPFLASLLWRRTR